VSYELEARGGQRTVLFQDQISQRVARAVKVAPYALRRRLPRLQETRRSKQRPAAAGKGPRGCECSPTIERNWKRRKPEVMTPNQRGCEDITCGSPTASVSSRSGR
jgi:hypothetical protein